MKRKIRTGEYVLFETKKRTRILVLDRLKFAWINIPKIGDILVKTYANYTMANILSTGKYNIYEIEGEKDFVDLLHLELEIASNRWQGYLLPKGLPSLKQKRHRIIPTDEVVTPTRFKVMHITE